MRIPYGKKFQIKRERVHIPKIKWFPPRTSRWGRKRSKCMFSLLFNRGKWLGNLAMFVVVVCFCLLFWGLPCTKPTTQRWLCLLLQLTKSAYHLNGIFSWFYWTNGTARFCTKETNRLNRIIWSEVSDVIGPGSGCISTPGYQEETRRPAALNELPVVPGVLSDDLENYFLQKTTMTISSVWLLQQLHFVSKTSKKGITFFSENIPPGWTVPCEIFPELPKIPFKW